MRQFRPNIVVCGAEAWQEDKWMTILVGPNEACTQIELKLVKPCTRCNIPTISLKTAEKSANEEPLKTIKAKTNLSGCFGQNVQHSLCSRGHTFSQNMKLFLVDSKSEQYLSEEARKLARR